jgi:Ca-activated chloride channel family protein
LTVDMTRAGAGFLLALASLVAPAALQQSVFRVARTTVAVPASVFDAGGNVVRDLTRDDFAIFDNGARQDIVNFASGTEPFTAVVLVDTSASMILDLDTARAGAEQFVIRMRPDDLAMVGSFSDRIALSGRFTADRDELLRALRDDLHIGNPTRLFDAIHEAFGQLARGIGRRVVMVFTDGCDTASQQDLDSLLRRVRTEEYMVYSVQLPFRRSRALGPNRRCQGCGCDLELDLANTSGLRYSSLNDPRLSLSGGYILQRLAAETGGGVAFLGPTTDVNSTATWIASELHHQYLLGFVPPKLDGKSHELEVRVKRPNLTVRARRSYLAPPPAK